MPRKGGSVKLLGDTDAVFRRCVGGIGRGQDGGRTKTGAYSSQSILAKTIVRTPQINGDMSPSTIARVTGNSDKSDVSCEPQDLRQRHSVKNAFLVCCWTNVV